MDEKKISLVLKPHRRESSAPETQANDAAIAFYKPEVQRLEALTIKLFAVTAFIETCLLGLGMAKVIPIETAALLSVPSSTIFAWSLYNHLKTQHLLHFHLSVVSVFFAVTNEAQKNEILMAIIGATKKQVPVLWQRVTVSATPTSTEKKAA
jgi:hypothetical protein